MWLVLSVSLSCLPIERYTFIPSNAIGCGCVWFSQFIWLVPPFPSPPSCHAAGLALALALCQSASLCLRVSFLPIFCCTLLNPMLPNGSRCCPSLVFSTSFYFFGLRSYICKWSQQWCEVAVPVSSFRVRAPFPLPEVPGLPPNAEKAHEIWMSIC